jgi:ribokinase
MDVIAVVESLPRPGETVLGRSLTRSPGGKGGNQAVAAAKAGADVRIVACVGEDAAGDDIEAALRTAGIDTHLVRRVDLSTGTALVTVDAHAENSIVVVPGANSALKTLSEDDKAAIRSAALVVAQLEIPMRAVAEAAQTSRAANVPFLLNPSPVAALPASVVAATDVMVVNEGEAAALGRLVLDAVPHVVVTLGAKGAEYRGPDGDWARIPAPSVAAIDTTGAGDVFAGALASAWVRGVGPLEAVRVACAAGALATLTRGAAQSAPAAASIEALLAQHDASTESTDSSQGRTPVALREGTAAGPRGGTRVD